MTSKHICPRCGAEGAAEIVYGMPAFSDEFQHAMENGEVFVGGCCVSGEDPKYKCRSCGYAFGRPGGDPAQSDFEIAAEMYELYEPEYVSVEEAAGALEKQEAERLFFEYDGKPYIIDCRNGYTIQVPAIDFKDIGWRGSKVIVGPFKTFDEMSASPAFNGKSLNDIAGDIPNGFYRGW